MSLTIVHKLKLFWLYLILPSLLLLSISAWNTSKAEYSIGADDILVISVYDHEDLESKVKVSTDGYVSFPFIGKLNVLGKSTFTVEQMIARLLHMGKFVPNAQVSVSILENNSQLVSVLGYVNKPGRYSLDSVTTLVDVIAMAGGINETGAKKVILTRYENGKAKKQIIDLHVLLSSMEKNNFVKIKPQDKIYVPRAPMFYIYGEVQHPGEYPVVQDLSVVKALSIGGGLTLRGTQNGVVIKRKNNSGEMMEVDVELTDIVLKDDVVFVKERLF